MALIIRVYPHGGELLVSGQWEDGRPSLRTSVTRIKGYTAAETVELFMLENYDMVASWTWGSEPYPNAQKLIGQFVHAAKEGRAYKEVANSNAHLFDI